MAECQHRAARSQLRASGVPTSPHLQTKVAMAQAGSESRAREMAQWERGLVTRTEGLSSILRTQTVEENRLL